MRIDNFGHGLHRLVYVSRIANIPPAQLGQEVSDIIENSSRNNAAHALTGLLVAHEGFFIQALEGSHETITALMPCIAADPRHEDIKIIGVELITERAFGRWSMRGAQSRPTTDGGFDPYVMSMADLMGLLRVSAVMSGRFRRKAAA